MLAIRLPDDIESASLASPKKPDAPKHITLAKPSFNIWMTWKTSTSRKKSWKRSAPDEARLFRWKKSCGSMAWKIDFSSNALKQLRKLDKPIASRILKSLRGRIEKLDDPGKSARGCKARWVIS